MRSPLHRIRFGAVSLVTVFLASTVGYRYLDGKSWLDSIWMVVITISTVGFSEHSESTPAVQILTICVILFGVSASVYAIGGFFQMVLEGEVERALGNRKMTMELARLNNHVIVCGYGGLGHDLADQLSHRNLPFVVVDVDPEKVQLATENGMLALQGDATSEEVMQQLHIPKARALATALPTDAENVFITLTARNLCPKIQIISKSERESSCRKLRQAGADKIVMPHRVGAQQMERMISRPTTADLVELFAEASHLEMELDEFLIAESSRLAGSTLGESKIREMFDLLVVGIKDGKGEFHFNPKHTETISAGDMLLVMGRAADITRMKASHA